MQLAHFRYNTHKNWLKYNFISGVNQPCKMSDKVIINVSELCWTLAIGCIMSALLCIFAAKILRWYFKEYSRGQLA